MVSASQLAYLINSLRNRATTRQMIEDQITNPRHPTVPDVAATKVLDFIRLWATFHFPRLLRAINNIQRDVLSRESRKTGSYDFYASQVESLFLNPAVTAIEEFGIPIEIGRKLSSLFSGERNLDAAIDALKTFDVNQSTLSAFEKAMVEEAKRHL